MSLQALREAADAHHIFVLSWECSRLCSTRDGIRMQKNRCIVLTPGPMASLSPRWNAWQDQLRKDSLCLLTVSEGSAHDAVALVFERACGQRACLSHGGQETTRGYRKRPGQPVAPKNMPHCNLLLLGRPHLLNFLQPSKVMPPAGY